jgi:hypothetical protein
MKYIFRIILLMLGQICEPVRKGARDEQLRRHPQVRAGACLETPITGISYGDLRRNI